MSWFPGSIQNNTLEERVALLEIQVDEMEDDIIIIRVDLTELEGDVNFLFDDQEMQDERLFSLEQETDAIDRQLDGISAEIEGTNPFDPCFVRHSFFNYVFLKTYSVCYTLQIYRMQL